MKVNSERPVQLFCEESTCPYFEDGRISTVEYLTPDSRQALKYHKYLERGYRRAGQIFYHNMCRECAACEPLRLDVEEFEMSKSQKRTLKKNDDIRVEITSRPVITPEKILLYEKYVRSKHAEKEKEVEDHISVLLTIHLGYHGTLEMDYYDEGKLIAVGIVDKTVNSLSSHYFYYDTGYSDRRLGVFSVLREISLALSLGLKNLYLGFYIEENQKMSYKKYFRPNQVYKSNSWVDFLKGR